MVIQDSLPLCGDQDSTLVHPNPEDWINTPWMMDLLDREREGQAAAQASSSSSACSPGVVGGEQQGFGGGLGLDVCCAHCFSHTMVRKPRLPFSFLGGGCSINSGSGLITVSIDNEEGWKP